MRFRCPSCHKALEATRAELPTLPFCSPRCRAADLGNWLNESYRIGSPASEEDLDEGLPRGVGAGPMTDEN
ncbi:MAG TPA: DNA gyrase inhibitor YacG [Polyangia bacterium]|nr:DNA gyrase inhibitor YacG [Polyangia bacterium]